MKTFFKKRGKFFRAVLFAFLGISIPLILAELFLRRFNPQITFSEFLFPYDFHSFTNKDYYPVGLKPNKDCILQGKYNQFKDTHVKTNSTGLRNPEIESSKPKDETRILFVGDSIAMGWGVTEDKSFPRVSEKILRQKFPAKKIEAINAGVPTTGPNYYYLFLKNEGIKLDPDIIVVAFWMLNDIPENVYFTDWLTVDSQGLPVKVRRNLDFLDSTGSDWPIEVPLKFKFPVIRNSHLFAYLMDTFVHQDGKSYESLSGLSPRACLYKKSCHDLDIAKAKAKKLFLGIKKLADDKGAKLLVAFVPSEFQIDRKARAKYDIEVPLTQADKDRPYNEFTGFFAENGIDYLDMRPSFKQDSDNIYYFVKDNHWNELGHNLAAEVISGRLMEMMKIQ